MGGKGGRDGWRERQASELATYLLKLSCDAAAAAGSRIVVGLPFLPQQEFRRSEPMS